MDVRKALFSLALLAFACSADPPATMNQDGALSDARATDAGATMGDGGPSDAPLYDAGPDARLGVIAERCTSDAGNLQGQGTCGPGMVCGTGYADSASHPWYCTGFCNGWMGEQRPCSRFCQNATGCNIGCGTGIGSPLCSRTCRYNSDCPNYDCTSRGFCGDY
jgi:hypothetical protein